MSTILLLRKVELFEISEMTTERRFQYVALTPVSE